jgi:phytoene dehydrogenase-like protein
MTMLAQDCGFLCRSAARGPLTAAMVNRASAAGAQLECGRRVDAIEIRGGRAVAVHTADGSAVWPRRGVIADVAAPNLYEHLLPRDALPARLFASFRALHLGHRWSK